MAHTGITATVDYSWQEIAPGATKCACCGEASFGRTWRLDVFIWVNESSLSVTATDTIICDDCYQEFINP